MTTCEKIQSRLTAYLDGELADEHGSVVRGHLRECAACRQVARDEAALRDGLRVLLPVDPPATLWAGVQAQLAAAEVADAHKPWWRRTWARWAPNMSQFAAGGLVAAAATGMLVWRAHRAAEPQVGPVVVAPVPTPAPESGPPVGPPHSSQHPSVPANGDVTADLIAEPARTTASYGQAIEELMKLASEARAGWTDEQKAAFDAKIAALRNGIARAAPGRPQQRAQRALIRALQGAVVRDDILLASGGTR
jgi:anti-sigma factor RsiW